MNESLLNRILKDHKRRTRSLALILCLSMIVSLGTFAGFHKTAIAKVYTREVLDCPYAREGAEPVAHVHNDDCYEGETLVCTLPEREAHTHDDTCYAESRLLSCGLEENPGHQHSEACFDENGELICQIPEGEGAHSHTEECYTIERALVCNQPELPVHVHDAGCFRTEEITVDEPEEAIETEQTVSSVPEMPVSDPNADLETSDDWNREFENLELSGNWARDLVLVAATQQGRGESPNNFEAVLNDAGDAWVRHGYTRYGAWYGYPYAEWDAMFVSFCLRYAGIPVENVPNNPTAALMAESFSMGELFAGQDYVPAVGDLIFFDTVDDEITNIDHMGIVYHVDAENGTINTVEGDRTDAVTTFGYYLNDEQIVGYGILPQNPNYVPNEEENTDVKDEAFDGFIFMTMDEEEETEEAETAAGTTDAEDVTVPSVPMPAQSWERTAGGIKVSVEAPEGAFPENTKIAVTPVNGSSLKDTVSDAVDGEVLEVQAVDITFFDAEGREIEPAVPIRVVMTPAATQHAEEKTSVVHVDVAQQTAELIEQAEGTETDNSEVVFDAEAFTIYAIVYTVDFEYGVNGKLFTSSMPGAEDMPLSEIVKGLGIVDEEELETFVSKIASVTSTNEEVAVVTEARSVRVLKDGDAQIVITMQDGAAFSIDVSAEGVTEISDENEIATVSTVNDLYLPASGEVKAELLTKEQGGNAIAAVQTAEESSSYQAFSIALENVDVTAYDGFNVAVTLPEDAVVGRDFQLYQVKEDGTATDITESLTVAGKPNEEGLQNVSGISFTTEDFADFVLSYSIETFYTTAGGDTYKITLNYGPKAGIPEGADLKVQEILPEDESYTNYLNESAAKLGVNSGDVSFARFFDIEIRKDDEKVEPAAPVQVAISLTDAPQETEPEDLKVVHFAEAGLETIDETQAEKKEDASVELSFETNGFSVFGVVTVPTAQPDPDVDNLDGKTFTISHDTRYVTTAITPIENNNNTNGFGKTNSPAQAARWFFERPAGSTGNTYYIYTFNEDNEKQYINLTKNNANTDRANATLSGSPQIFTVTRDGTTYRLATESNGTTYYLDEHNGNNGKAFAGWHGATNNGKLNLNFPVQPVMQNEGQYMTLVKYDGKYYIVNNDCSLTEVNYDDATKAVEVDDPMLWTINRNNPNGHIYFNSKEVGFNWMQMASDWYRRYLDPSSSAAFLEETNEEGPGHVDIDEGHIHTDHGVTYWEHNVTDRTIVENNTTVSIDNTSTSDSSLYTIYHGNSNDNNYLGVVANGDGSYRLEGKKSRDDAAEFLFASPTAVKPANWLSHTVDHIDISIAGTANVTVPLAYGKYYGSTAGDAADPILTVDDNIKIELSESELTDSDQLRITAEDMKRATVTASRLDNGKIIDDAFYITGYSGNVANGTSNDQVRIEGSFLVADLRDTDFEYVQKNNYNSNLQYKYKVNTARQQNIVEYTVTVVKPLEYKLIHPELGQLYDAEGNPITITVDVAFSASFNYWDEENECPAVRHPDGGDTSQTGYPKAEWENGGIDPTGLSGMDFVLGGNAEDPDSPLVALEITKVIMDEDGNRIELKTPVTNYFEIYEKKNASNDQKNGVKGRHVVDNLNHPEWQSDQRDATIREGYEYWRTKRVTVDESGSAIVFDFDATDAMYYIVEKHDRESLPETVMDQEGKGWKYVKTYIETEYVRRDDENGTHDEYSNKNMHPKAMHVTEDYTRATTGDYAYASIPEVAGKFIKLDGKQKKEGFLEFFVYNIYEPIETVDVPVDKTWDDFSGDEYYWEADFVLEEREILVDGPAYSNAITSWTPVSPLTTKTIHKDDTPAERTFTGLPKYRYYSNGSTYRILYSLTETGYTVRRGGPEGEIIYQKNADGMIGDDSYSPTFPHDAGDAEDSMHLIETDPNFYHIIVENHKDDRKVKKEINISLNKSWENGTFEENVIPDESFAKFKVQRLVTQSYREYGDNYHAETTYTVTLNGKAYSFPQGSHVYLVAEFSEGSNGNAQYKCVKSNNQETYFSIDRQNNDPLRKRYEVTSNLSENMTLIRTNVQNLREDYLTDLHEGETTAAQDTEWNNGRDPVFLELNNSNSWSDIASDLVQMEEGPVINGHQNIYTYSYYLVEVDSNPSGYYPVLRESNASNAATLGTIQYPISSTATVYAENKKTPPFVVKKVWRGVPEGSADNYPEIKFTLYQAELNNDNYQNSQSAWVYVDEGGTRYENIPLNAENNWTWNCPVKLPDKLKNGNDAKYYVVETPSSGSVSNVQWEVYGYSTEWNTETHQYNMIALGNQPHGANIQKNGDNEITGTLIIHNSLKNYMQMDVKKKYIDFSQNRWDTLTADVVKNTVLGFKVIRKTYDMQGNVLHEWEDYGKEMLVGYGTGNENIGDGQGNTYTTGQHIESNEGNGFYLFYAGLWHWTILDQGGNLNGEHIGLPKYGFYTKADGTIVPTVYAYSIRETGVYADLERHPWKDVNEEEWDWWSTITPPHAFSGDTNIVPNEVFYQQDDYPVSDSDRVNNYKASDLLIDKIWLGEADNAVQEVYIKVYRYDGDNSEPVDFTEIIAEDIKNNHNWQGYVTDPSIVDTTNNWLILNNQDNWTVDIVLQKALIGSLGQSGASYEYHYYAVEVGYKDAAGVVHAAGDLGKFDPHYDKKISNNWQNTPQIDPKSAQMAVGSVGQNAVRVINAPITDFTAKKLWHDKEGNPLRDEQIAGKTATFKVKQYYTASTKEESGENVPNWENAESRIITFVPSADAGTGYQTLTIALIRETQM